VVRTLVLYYFLHFFPDKTNLFSKQTLAFWKERAIAEHNNELGDGGGDVCCRIISRDWARKQVN